MLRSLPVTDVRAVGSRDRLRAQTWLRGLLLPGVLLIGWEILSRLGFFPPNLLPPPSAVLSTLWELALSGALFQHIGITLYRVAVGFVLGTAIATIFGAITGYSPFLHDFLDPLLQSLRNIPSLAWVPLFILWLGIDETSKIALIAVGVFFPVYLNLMSGIQTVDRKLVEVGKAYRLSDFQLIQRVAAEIMGSSQGLGFLLVDGQTTGRPTVILASIFLFAIFGKLTDSTLAAAGQRFLNWQDSYHSQSY